MMSVKTVATLSASSSQDQFMIWFVGFNELLITPNLIIRFWKRKTQF